MRTDQQLALISLSAPTSGDPRYPMFLFEAALRLSPSVVAEMGTYNGASALAFALGAPSATIYTIDNGRSGVDPRLNEERWAGILGTENRIVQIRDDSWNLNFYVQESTVDLAFIDADHSFASARQDAGVMMKLLASEGVLLLDDLNLGEGVRDVFEEIRDSFEAVAEFDIHNGIAALGPRSKLDLLR